MRFGTFQHIGLWFGSGLFITVYHTCCSSLQVLTIWKVYLKSIKGIFRLTGDLSLMYFNFWTKSRKSPKTKLKWHMESNRFWFGALNFQHLRDDSRLKSKELHKEELLSIPLWWLSKKLSFLGDYLPLSKLNNYLRESHSPSKKN